MCLCRHFSQTEEQKVFIKYRVVEAMRDPMDDCAAARAMQ